MEESKEKIIVIQGVQAGAQVYSAIRSRLHRLRITLGATLRYAGWVAGAYAPKVSRGPATAVSPAGGTPGLG